MQQRHRIRFPKDSTHSLNQDEAYFFLQSENKERKIRFHDYNEIYKIPGLYEQLFYDRLKCNSPSKVTSILHSAIEQKSSYNFTELRALDLGAGNGIMGEELKKQGVSRLIGVDIIPEAYEAMIRDRPNLYDSYYIEDFCRLDTKTRKEIASWQLDCLVSVAALGFGDISIKAFIEAFNIIQNQGWVAFNIKETFLEHTDNTGFSRMIRELVFSKYLNIYCIERYRHRLSTEGEPLYYFALVGWKNSDVPLEFLEAKEIIL
ncbi:class I SAM-dependent DNA methyltransferase [Candidatus Nitrosacidococcus tergens]|uniref:Methyltransferase domain family n=1 Tax=Candidatus Nitrosacidococcus tergens TaxID=553981 RepID=A0A7G1QAA3_9GAMM|nr:class I SAM-dependent methyltransferase [Candidatus Nitrosacidococcus tergens]CAB1276400.1 Methyltransferase domain family [Candidatus Nitrosacidococcus tergens]